MWGFKSFWPEVQQQEAKTCFTNKPYRVKTETNGNFGTKRGYLAANRENDEPSDK